MGCVGDVPIIKLNILGERSVWHRILLIAWFNVSVFSSINTGQYNTSIDLAKITDKMCGFHTMLKWNYELDVLYRKKNNDLNNKEKRKTIRSN